MKRTLLFGGFFVLLAAKTAYATEPAKDDAATPSDTKAPEEASQPPASAPPPTAEKPKPAPKPPYSLPWQLRPVLPVSAIRLDSSFAIQDAAFSSAYLLTGSYRPIPELSIMARLAVTQNNPDKADAGAAFVNPAVGVTVGGTLVKYIRMSGFVGVTIPVGMGGGDEPDPAILAARSSGVYTRCAMDNALFAVNDLTIFPGFDFAVVADKFTMQFELTLLELIRVRGEAAQPDEFKTNLTMGVHAGYYFIPQFSVGAELRHQRWLTTPAAVAANPALRNTTSFAVGPRGHFQLAETIWIHPGLAYTMGVDDPMLEKGYKIIQVDIPVTF
ncbi:MAG: hypothetical protein U0271_01995 [Polyangiaceae bacterium]